MMKLKRAHTALLVAGLLVGLSAGAFAAGGGLDSSASIVYDQWGVPTIVAQTERDAIFLQGYQHAKDRLFQMDQQRHLFSGRLSEMVGSSAIPTDVQLRTLGLRRAAERSLTVQTPEILDWLQWYSDGVNACIQDESIPLPPEYAGLELDRSGIEPWTPVDSLTMVKGLAFGLSFGLEDIDNTLALLEFLAVGDILGFNGLQLHNTDLYRVAPFDPTVSIPGAPLPPTPALETLRPAPQCDDPSGSEGGPANIAASQDCDPAESDEEGEDDLPSYMSDPNFKTLVQNYRAEIEESPYLLNMLEADPSGKGSNWWIASSALTASGHPMIANDPHLALDTPSTFYEIHLNVTGGINVTGSSFPGAPGVVIGCNDVICWGATVNPMDVTDVYQEVLQALDPSQPTLPTHTTFDGLPEPLQFIPQTFFVNIIGNSLPNTIVDAGVPADQGGLTFVVPRRNEGPIVQVLFDPSSPTPLTGISVQYTGWSATQELECFRQFARASTPQDFKDALQFFDVGSQNWAYADINGNIAYYTSAELPIREDLQTLFFPGGLQPPNVIRSGTHEEPHEWMTLTNPQPNQALGTEILPFAEMPQIENPASGYILNANNDPIGTTLDNVAWNQFRAGFNGLLYISSGYATGFRMGRIQQLWDDALASGPVTLQQYKDFQANNQLLDAEVLSPYLLTAFTNAGDAGAPPELTALGTDPEVAEAIGRIAAWDFSTPTGIQAGYDPGDDPNNLPVPSQAEIDNSIAATLYANWRSQVVQRVIDQTLANLPIPQDHNAPGTSQSMTALRRLLDNYSTAGGTGASLINFFVVPGISDPFHRRDIILLQALRDSLDLLASAEMTPAFGGSTNQEDYRWGKLHRIVFDHLLGPSLSIPPLGGLSDLAPDLPGVARSGGMGAVDASSHSARADGLNEFMFGSGPARRMISTMTPDGPDMLEVIPGGESGIPTHPQQADQLKQLWLVNDYKSLHVDLQDVLDNAAATVDLVCGNAVVTVGEQCDDGNLENGDGCNAKCQIEVPIPTVSEWGLIVMVLLLLTVGSIIFSRRRQLT